VAASKYADAEGIRALALAGQAVFGENRVQDAMAKSRSKSLAGQKIEWHLIGHLQGNKSRAAAETFDVVQSVDSLEIAAELSRRAVALGRVVPVLLQVNVDEDPSKHGFYTGSLAAEFGSLVALEGLRVDGLMTIGAQVGTAEAARPTFAALRAARARLDGLGLAPPLRHLSMGMSADFEVAIEEGATIVRVGRALFDGEMK
jgi:pyridoxal phosphate enzyme (YggS family)